MAKRSPVENQNKGRFASFVLPIVSVQRFYRNSSRRTRDTWLEKYTYRTVDEARDSSECLRKNSRSPPSLTPDKLETHLQHHESNNKSPRRLIPCRNILKEISFAFDPFGVTYFIWLSSVSVGVLYNYWALILRIAFPAIQKDNLISFLCLDYFFDFIFVLDILVQSRTGFLSEGQLVLLSSQMRRHYFFSTGFIFDCLSILPLDFLFFALGYQPLVRLGKLLKCNRFFLFCERGEIHSGRPKLFNLIKLLHYLFLIIHWVACLYFIVSRYEGLGREKWVHPKLEDEWAEVKLQYVYCFFRSTVSLTTVGSGISPNTLSSLVFVIVTYLCGVLIFATIVGNASDMIVDFRRSREQYLKRVDGMKEYCAAHKLPDYLQLRVVQWFDYLWTYKKDIQDEQLFQQMNDRIKADIAIHVHLATLKKVKMFQECDPGFLRELVLKLKPHLCSPGDYVCRKNDIGRDMYIVNKGHLKVIDHYGNTLSILVAGEHFGEISILNIKGIGNRRTASVRSVGYSDLFQLSKDDLEGVLKYYPESKAQLKRIAKETYERQRKHRREIVGETDSDDSSTSDQDNSKVTVSHSDRDPRKWFFADKKSLRRRLSDIEAVLEIRNVANRFKRKKNEKEAQAVVAEFANRVKWNNNNEARVIIEDFVRNTRKSRNAATPLRSKSVKIKISTSQSFPCRKRTDSLPDFKSKPSPNFLPITIFNEESGSYEVSDIMMYVNANTEPRMRETQKPFIIPKIVVNTKENVKRENYVVNENESRVDFARPRSTTIATSNVFSKLKRISYSREQRKFLKRSLSTESGHPRDKSIASRASAELIEMSNLKKIEETDNPDVSNCDQSTDKDDTATSRIAVHADANEKGKKHESLESTNAKPLKYYKSFREQDLAHVPCRRIRSSNT